jgi:hypothetical protein
MTETYFFLSSQSAYLPPLQIYEVHEKSNFPKSVNEGNLFRQTCHSRKFDVGFAKYSANQIITAFKNMDCL